MRRALKKATAAVAVVALIFGAMTPRGVLADIGDIRGDWTMGTVAEIKSHFRETLPVVKEARRARRRRPRWWIRGLKRVSKDKD